VERDIIERAVLSVQKGVENKNCHSPLLPALSKEDAPEAMLLSGKSQGTTRRKETERERERERERDTHTYTQSEHRVYVCVCGLPSTSTGTCPHTPTAKSEAAGIAWKSVPYTTRTSRKSEPFVNY